MDHCPVSLAVQRILSATLSSPYPVHIPPICKNITGNHAEVFAKFTVKQQNKQKTSTAFPSSAQPDILSEKAVTHRLPLVNLREVIPVTSLSFTCLEVASRRVCPVCFPETAVQLPHSSLRSPSCPSRRAA